MSLKRVNLLFVLVLGIVMYGGFFYTYSATNKYFENESLQRMKKDILELGYSIATLIENNGVESSKKLLQKSLQANKEYKTLSIAIDDKIVVSTDINKINTDYYADSHLDTLYDYELEGHKVFYKEFAYFDKGKRVYLNLIIDLNDDYIKSDNKELPSFVITILIYFIILMAVFLIALYYINILPILRLSKYVKRNEFYPINFFIKDYASLYNSFTSKYNEIALLNKTLEDKVANRTKLVSKTNILFKEAQKLTKIGNWEWNLSDNTIVWSDEIYVIFGLQPQEFLATYETFINTVHAEDKALVQDAVSKALQSGEEYSVKHRIVLPDGSERVVYEKGKVELDENNKPIRMMGTVQDITQSFKREQELEFQSRLLNSVTDSILVHNIDGSFIYVNESAYATRGYTKDELMSMKVQDLDYSDEKEGSEIYNENIKKIKAQLEKNHHAVFEVSHKCKSGTSIPLEVTSRLMNEGNKTYIISIARDISERKIMDMSLKISEKRYRTLVENSQVGIFTSTIGGKIIYVNDAMVHIMDYESAEDMCSYNSSRIYKYSNERIEFLKELTAKGKVEEIEIHVLTKNNDEKIVLLSAHIEGEIISGIVMDITESKKSMQEITKLSKAIEEIDDIIMISDRTGVLTFVNDAYVVHTGFTREESIGKTASILKSGKHDKTFYTDMWKQILSDKVFRGVFVNRKKDGELYYEEKTISAIKNEEDEIISFVSTGKDITQRIEMQQDLEKLASTDQLTGIYNRHKFEELFKLELERVARYKNPLSIILFDIDFFKKINDTHGHDVGDTVLKSIVSVVIENIRNIDIFVRWGGEEFLILCPETDSENAVILAQKLRIKIESTTFGVAGNVTSSFGVTSYREDDTENSFIKRADDCLYKAKHEGRNRVVAIL
ncbi:sensor domain-containing diguanylate cyclase [Candidatus Sulfurimonas baltica]|uniref:Diguanylate cyclase n=1 Tax=Candidatus Sulfurimonas baltica TaxID=2740404 RepID=A0A7S7RM84_9BACT|nr:diguanylate cyclase [Candidatus Sulfurimonas baltica]QOY51314.1 diguanylate cyclase [Candidatus Sulfurimonas baltica]